MAVEIIYAWGPGESRLAVVRDRRPIELMLLRPETLSGAVLLGRVVEVMPKLGGVFVDIGQPHPAFLPDGRGLTKGTAILVQVKADPRGEKGATITMDIVLPGRFLAYAPFRPGVALPRKLSDDKKTRLFETLDPALTEQEGLIVRTQAASAKDGALEGELEQHRSDWKTIQTPGSKPPCLLWRPDPLVRLLADHPGVSRILIDDPEIAAVATARHGDLVEWYREGSLSETYDLEETIAAALAPVVPLACGGRIAIETTAALTAIDVDSGNASPAEANFQAVAMIARQLHLRNIAGQIVVDFVAKGGKGPLFKLAAALKQAVMGDPVPTHVIGVTSLGLVEMTRERRGTSLTDLLWETVGQPTAESVGLEGLRRVLREAVHRPGKSLTLVVAPEVATALDKRPEAVAATQKRVGGLFVVQADSGKRREELDVV